MPIASRIAGPPRGSRSRFSRAIASCISSAALTARAGASGCATGAPNTVLNRAGLRRGKHRRCTREGEGGEEGRQRAAIDGEERHARTHANVEREERPTGENAAGPANGAATARLGPGGRASAPLGYDHVRERNAPAARGASQPGHAQTAPATDQDVHALRRINGSAASAAHLRPRPRPGPQSPLHFRPMHQARFATAAMGTRFELVLFSEEPAQHRAAAEAAIEEIEAAHRRYTRFASDSLVSHINRTAAHTPVRLDADTFAMFEDALRVELDSCGAFSITTTTPLPLPWPRPGFVLNPEDRSVTLLHDEAKIDLGAIAKGHALDLAAALLREHGVTCALLHGGTSSVVAIGAPPGEDGWRIALGPESGAPTITLRDAALGVSATTERPHIVDPRTGAPAPPNRRAAVIGPSARLADAWATALVVLGERPPALGPEWMTFIDDLGGAHAESARESHAGAEVLAHAEMRRSRSALPGRAASFVSSSTPRPGRHP